MASRQQVYFPPRLALSGIVSGNLIQQLEFTEHIEEVELETYNKNRVSGWTLKKENGESILVVSKKTTAKFEGSILLFPSVSTIPSSKNDSVDGQKWLLPKLKKNRIKSNLFTRGYENGKKMTIGGSHKGRIWSHRIADDISEWVEWCKCTGAKLLDSSISTEQILEQSIIPEKISERPNLVPIAIDWSPYFYARSDEAVQIEINGRVESFYSSELEITTFSNRGFLRFGVSLEGVQIEYEIIFKENIVTYIQLGNAEVNLCISGKKDTLSKWFQVEPPIIRFEDTSILKYDEIYRSKNNREPYDKSKIECWSWQNVDLKKESQYKANASSNTLILRQDSIQRQVIESLKQENDIVFDDDGAGEIADIVTLKVAGDNLLVNLFHCKYSKSETAGVRVGDLYEVCGQAQKSVFWRSEISKLFQRLKFREQERQKKYSVSRFEKGDLQKLEELRRHSRSLHSKFHIYIVQPGIKTLNISTQILDLLGATELYLSETFNVPLTVVASA